MRYSREKFRADYDVVSVTDDKVFIEDLNAGNRSVTNDAENVVAEVNQSYPNRRIIYKDSMGQWDELCHNNGVFTGFLPYKENL